VDLFNVPEKLDLKGLNNHTLEKTSLKRTKWRDKQKIDKTISRELYYYIWI